MQSDISMSASPADRTPGRTPGRTPNGGPPPVMKRPKKSDPLVRPKDKQKRRLPMPPTTNGPPPQNHRNGPRLPAYGQPGPLHPNSGRSAPPFSRPPKNGSENAISGFTSAPVAPFMDYPLIMTKKSLMEGYRHHIARFASKKNVDPRNPEEFVRPVRLHRRDPRFQPSNGGIKDEDRMFGMTEDSKEAEMKVIAKAERDARREAENSLVAPSTGGSSHKKLGTNLKKTEQVYRNDLTEEQKARTKLRYEEAMPWHLEDFDNKSTWVGTYEAALSDTYAMIVQGPDGAFRMTPLEKWYKFTQKNQFKTLTIEEAEMRFNKKIKEPRWFMDSEEAKRKRELEQGNKKAGSGLFLGKWEKGGGGSGVAAPVTKQENADADDLDFTEDRFADDEENMLFEEDDETKEAEERIKRDQLQANVFDLKEEKEYEKQEQIEKREKEAEKKLGKRVKKALMKREKNYIYDSDSGSNPYSSSSGSESDTTEAERLKAEEKEKAKVSDASKSTPDKHTDRHKSKSKSALASGTSTPSHRPQKSNTIPLSRTASTSSLKRPGSPLASDASGNESSRKKAKKSKHLHPTNASSSQPQTQQQPISRPNSPPIPPSSAPQPSAKRPRGAGPGSDSEGGAQSGGEMSDGTRKRQKLRLTLGSKEGSPNGSRAGSPVVEGGRAGSAGANPPSQPTQPSSSEPPAPTPAEIRACIPESGITIPGLLACFRGRLSTKERNSAFTKMMKESARFDKERKILLPLH